jgi:hypothetical protein
VFEMKRRSELTSCKIEVIPMLRQANGKPKKMNFGKIGAFGEMNTLHQCSTGKGNMI